MQPDRFTAIDDAIVTEVAMAPGEATYAKLCVRLKDQADAIQKGNGDRVIDRRLQALRKRGKLAYDRKEGWTVATW